MGMDVRTALITGVGKPTGLGFEAARQLLGQGFRVVVTARRKEAAEELAGILGADSGSVFGLPLDVESDDSIREAVGKLGEMVRSLDVLINNAAIVGGYGVTSLDETPTDARRVFEANFFGLWSVTQAMLPLLRAGRSARIVNVSSGAGTVGDMAFGLRSETGMAPSYQLSKAAVNALTVRMAKDLRGEGILVNAVCPGFTATFEGAEAMGARPVEDGAKGIVWAATLPDDGPTGGLFRDGEPIPW